MFDAACCGGVVDGLVTVTAMVVVWDVDPLVPVTVTVYGPVPVLTGTAIVSVLAPDAPRVSDVGFREACGPDGDTTTEVDTIPVKPLRLVKVIVEAALSPA